MSGHDVVRVAEQDIAYVASGGAGRSVVFVHGNSASSRTWDALLTGAFGERFRCLALDLPGHGRSSVAARDDVYSLPGYAAILTGFIKELGADDAVIVGWSLGGHIALEAAPNLPETPGFVVFGTPPVASAEQLGQAFLPNPALNVTFTAEIDTESALSFAKSQLAPGSSLPLDELVTDILATDGTARAALLASIGAGNFADEIDIVAHLPQPIAVLHGEAEQLVSLDYLRTLTIPTLWRHAVQVLPAVGHSPQLEAPQEFAEILTEFITDLD
ncbi:alpha/beta fold hydrolase [Sphaerisporangium aureirubrum]|uniref:Alpha/beta fold hydrolase n=1 Tax=Sphaerisporangium aureirubrum TaxID=1544736 RepID=A0ABW1NLX2_9ACTN